MRRILFFGWLMSACAPSAGVAPATPAAPPASATAAPAPTPPDQTPPAQTGPQLQVPPPPQECSTFTGQSQECPTGSTFEQNLANALEVEQPAQRDRHLACLEGSRPESAALLRALRAELAPVACGDAIVGEFLASSPQKLRAEEESVLLGLMVAGKLNRLANGAPALTPPFDKPHFQEFFEQTLKPWLLAQAVAIGGLSQEGARLSGYGKAIAAIEAGLADMRFVQVARGVALPKELAADPEVKNVYYAALDEALEPRKARGRDAALVGLRLLGELGVLADGRLTRARQLLADTYGGSRLDALEQLLLPALPPPVLDSPEARLAARLPPFYAQSLLPIASQPLNAARLRAFGAIGLPPALRARLQGEQLEPDARRLFAELELRRGNTYFSGAAFRNAAEIASPLSASDAEARFVEALARALQAAPKDAAELMLGSPRLPPLGPREPLKAVAAAPGPFKSMAEFDDAYLDYIAPAPEADAGYWFALGARFQRAARGLPPGAGRTLAQQLARSAELTGSSLRGAPKR